MFSNTLPIFHQSLPPNSPSEATDLCGTDNGLADSVAPSGHHLLGQENLLCWDFNAQVSTGNHDAVTSLQNLIKSSKREGKITNSSQRFRSLQINI